MAGYGTAPPRALYECATPSTRTTRRETSKDGLAFVHGLALAIPTALIMWALIIWAVRSLIL